MKLDWRIAVTAIVCIAGLEAYALSQGVNGAILAIAIAAISGLAGYELRIWRDKEKH